MGNSYGHSIRTTIFGQSHAPAIGAVIDGLPAGMALDLNAIRAFMARRAPGGELSTARRETDEIRILSGLNERGETCGAPLCAVIENSDIRSKDYQKIADLPRPGHADYPMYVKHNGHNDVRGGGASSGRLTAPLCFAGAVLMQLPAMRGVKIGARIASIGAADDAPISKLDEHLLDSLRAKPLPTIDDGAAEKMRGEILSARAEGDSIGGVIECYALNVPVGLGDPMFDGLENAIACAVFAIPGVRGIEFGLGFAAARLRGSAHNDPFMPREDGSIATDGNNHGGILGGLSSGMPIICRVAFKPTPSIAKEQRTVSLTEKEARILSIEGRHDPCIVPRAVPCVEAALALAIADFI